MNHSAIFAIKLLLLLLFVLLAIICTHIATSVEIDPSKQGPSSNLKSNSNSIENEWQLEDEFCEQLTTKNNTICECVYSELNRLSVLCEDENSQYDHQTLVENLQQTLQLLHHSHQLHLDELVLANMANLKSLTFSQANNPLNVELDVLRIINCARLKSIALSESVESAPNTFANQLNTLEIVNTSLDYSIFKFIRQFPNLHTVLLNDLKFDQFSFTSPISLSDDRCSPIRRLALNHRCTKGSHVQHLPNQIFIELCQIRVLELSCLGLFQLDPLALQVWSKQSQNITRKAVHLDLSHNRLSKNVTKLLIEQLASRPSTSNIDTIYLNLDDNPIEGLTIPVGNNVIVQT